MDRVAEQKETLNDKGQNLETFLREYKTKELNQYEKPSVTVDTLVFTVRNKMAKNYRKLPKKELYVLLVKRGNHPYIGDWALPGGFVNLGENIDEAVLRELKEETNLEQVYTEQLYTFGDPDRDPRTRIISVSYLALISHEHEGLLKAGDDAFDAMWFKVDSNLITQRARENEDGRQDILQEYHLKLTPERESEKPLSARLCIKNTPKGKSMSREVKIIESEGIAFDHAKIITYGLERIKNKLEYTDIIFNLMPSSFTLSELQQVHELLLGEKVYAAQFRRKIEQKLTKLGDLTEGKGHRPAQHYSYNPLWKLAFEKEVYGL